MSRGQFASVKMAERAEPLGDHKLGPNHGARRNARHGCETNAGPVSRIPVGQQAVERRFVRLGRRCANVAEGRRSGLSSACYSVVSLDCWQLYCTLSKAGRRAC